MSKVVVTGGAGFIGSHITDKLLESGHQVLVIDNLSTGKREQVSCDAQFREMDITDPELAEVLSSFRPEVVIHHAAQVSVSHSIQNLMHDARVNIMGSLNVLEAARASGARKVLYASSAAAYGMPSAEVITEQHAIKPISFYGVSKHTPEQYLAVIAELFGLDYTVLRYANVYGSRQDPFGEGGVVSIFANRLLAGKTPVVHGDGEQTRDFIHVHDIAQANLAAMTRGSGATLNISSNHSTSVNKLLRSMCSLAGVRFAPEYQEPRAGDIRHSVLDNCAARLQLEWEPSVTLAEGLEETIYYYKRLNPQRVS